MTTAEIAAALLRGVRTFESDRLNVLDFYVARLGTELFEQDADKDSRLKDLALRFAVSDIIEGAGPQAVLEEIRKIAGQLKGPSRCSQRIKSGRRSTRLAQTRTTDGAEGRHPVNVDRQNATSCLACRPGHAITATI